MRFLRELRRKTGAAASAVPAAEGGRHLQTLATAVRAISAINRAVGLTLSWLSLAVVLVCFAVVVQRYFLHVTQLWLQDLYVWLSGAMFTGVAGYALLRGSAEQCASVRGRDDFQRVLARAGLVVDHLGVVDATLGEGIPDQMAVYTEAIGAVA